MTKKNFNKLMHFSDIETAYKNDQYPDAECMLTYPGEVTDNRPFTPAGINLKPLTITRNGSYNPADFDADGFSWVDADIHPTDKLVETITSNGDHDYTGDYKDATITVDVHPSETLEETLDERKTYNFIGEFNNAEIKVDVPYTDIHIASGPVASFEGENLPLKSLTASIVPVQSGSGDPSPTNVRPISGWTEEVVYVRGVNQWDEEWESGAINGANGEAYTDSTRIRSKNYISVLPNTAYYIKMPYAFNYSWYDAEKRYISGDSSATPNYTRLSPSNARYLKFSTTGTTYNNDISINYPSTDTEYHAYNGKNSTIDLGGTVYGGTLDVIIGTSGNEKTKEGVDLSSLTWEVRYTGEVNQTISSSLPSEYLQRTPVFMAEQYVRNGYVGGVASLNNPDERPIGIWNYRGSSSTETSTTTTIYMVVPKNTTPQGKLVYDMATPTTFYTQPTSIKSLDGENNIYANTGDVYVEYQTEWTQPVSDMTLDYAQISSISNKYMGAISTNSPIVPGFYAISHCNSDQIAGGTNLALVQIESLPTTLTLGGLSNFRLNVTSNSVEVDNYDGSAKDVYMSMMKIPDNAICVKTD